MAHTDHQQQQQTNSKAAAVPDNEKQAEGLSLPAVPAFKSYAPAQLKQSSSAANSQAVVQRALVPFKRPDDLTHADHQGLIADAGTINTLTEQAATNTWTKLNSGAQLSKDDFPGATEGHFTNFMARLQGHDNKLKAAATGYIIEDYVTHNTALPASATAQVSIGNARPDFVITRNGRSGVVDITSEGQQGHVMDKEFTKSHFATIDEATYGNFNFNDLTQQPAFSGDALEMAAAAKRRRADAFLGSQLYTVKRQGELYTSGIMWGNKAFSDAVTHMKELVNTIAAAGGTWQDQDIAVVDASITTVNQLLQQAGFNHISLRTLSTIIGITRTEYLVGGNPRWT